MTMKPGSINLFVRIDARRIITIGCSIFAASCYFLSLRIFSFDNKSSQIILQTDINLPPKHQYTGNNLPNVLSEVPSNQSYPKFTPLLDVIKRWSPDNPDIPSTFNESLLHFNYSDPLERSYAIKFRNAELPFKVYDIPEFDYVKDLWTNEYLNDVFKDELNYVERSKSNHFM